jgi:hypothetical protein
MRARALEAQELIAYLQSFSTLQKDEYGTLPPLFTKEATLREAAVGGRLMPHLEQGNRALDTGESDVVCKQEQAGRSLVGAW